MNFKKLNIFKFSNKIKSKVRSINMNITNEQSYDKIEQSLQKDFNEEIKFSILLLDTPVKLRYWLVGHTIPFGISIMNPFGVLWIYQAFWTGAAIGLAMHSYEFYANLSEKRVLNGFLILG
jgi:hypothetical protein